MIYQTTGARHFVSNSTRLELKNLQLKTGGHPSPAPTCAPTPSQSTRGRPVLSRAMTWRASAPRLPHLEDEGDGV